MMSVRRYVILMIMLFPVSLVWGQQPSNEKFKVAVYVSGETSGAIRNMLLHKTMTSLSLTGRYQPIERSSSYLQAVMSKGDTLSGTTIDDLHLSELGLRYGAQRVCVVDVTMLPHESYVYLSMRMLDAQRGVMLEVGEAEGSYYQASDLGEMVQFAVYQLVRSNSQLTRSMSTAGTVASKNVHPICKGCGFGGSDLEVANNDLEGLYTWDEARTACRLLGRGWELPSKQELSAVFAQKEAVGNFVKSFYWSGTQANAVGAWGQYFSSGKQTYIFKTFTVRVRCVRRNQL